MSEPTSIRRPWLLSKIALALAYLAASNPGALPRLSEIGTPSALLSFLAIWALNAGVMLLVSFHPSRPLRWLASALWVGMGAVGLVFWLITRRNIGVTDVESLIEAAAFAGDLLGNHGAQLARGAAASALGLLAINMPPFLPARGTPGSAGPSRRTAGLALAAVATLAVPLALVVFRGSKGTAGLPSQSNVPAMAAALLYERARSVEVPRRLPGAPGQDGPGARPSIVLIVDESVRGDLLDLNAQGTARSGLQGHASTLANFGVASSAANCSSTSNVSLRFAASKGAYLLDVQANPSLFEFARAAGYETHFLDGQQHDGNLHNRMEARELSFIDHFFQLPRDTAPTARDGALAARLRAVLEGARRPIFAIVNKMGAHFPYQDRYPRGAMPFQPTPGDMPRGAQADAAATALVAEPTPEGRLRIRNAYLNAVSWNCLQFFGTLLPGLDLRKAILVYTSDHGQDLHEDGRPGASTHCTSGRAPGGEGRVPLIVLSGDEPFLSELRQAAATNLNKASHFNLARSLLLWMGYQENDLRARLGPQDDLRAPLSADDQEFLSDFFVRFHTRPVWNRIW